jgi:Zn-dependent membrane protease YugP
VVFFDWTYMLCILLPTLLLSFGVQMYLKSTYSKWSQVANSENLTGDRVAQVIFQRASVDAIPLQGVRGSMTDHFDPGANIVRLSESTVKSPSVASMAIAAHELGHVQQYQTGSALIKARSALLPALRFSPTVSYIAILLGFMFNMVGLIWIGIIFFGLMVLFSLLTLPVEFDASKRGLALLTEAGLMQTEEDRVGSRKVLTAAGLTYLAAAITSILQLLYYISLAQRRR